MTLILASASPRRKQLLDQLGLIFDVQIPDVDERALPAEPVDLYVERLARAKADAVAGRPDAVVLAADTTVAIDGTLLGKPADSRDAVAMLRRLRGRTHRVHTGVVVAAPSGSASRVVTTDVTFAQVDDAAIDWYVSTGDPLDKAGSYGIQGSGGFLVAEIQGSYSNVIGLPLAELTQLFTDLDVNLGDLRR